MTNNIFIPEAQKTSATKSEEQQRVSDVSGANPTALLLKCAQYFSIALVGLLPLLFLPGVTNTLGFDKVIVSAYVVGIILVLLSALLVFTPTVRTIIPKSYFFFGGFVVWGVISAFVNGDVADSFVGRQSEVLTIGFLFVACFASVVPLTLQRSQSMISRALAVTAFAMVFFLLHTVGRLLFGTSFLDFGELTSSTETLVGSFNDAAIYAGLIAVTTLVTLFYLPLRLFVQAALGLVLILSLFVLAVVNLQIVWVLVAAVSIVLLAYSLLRKPLLGVVVESAKYTKLFTTASQVTVAVVALLFVFFGQTLSLSMNSLTNTSFLEIRPSASATIDTTRAVYEDSLLFGVGPNKFADAWRMHKDSSINQTVFWDTDFAVGYSFVSSVFVTFGLVGGLLLVLFTISFVVSVFKRIVAGTEENPFSSYVATMVFVGAVYLWLTSYLYVPGAGVLLLTAAFTGLSYATSSVLNGKGTYLSFAVTNSKSKVLISLIVSLVVVVCVIAALFSVTHKYNLEKRLATTEDLSTLVDAHDYDQLHLAYSVQKNNELISLIQNASPETLTQEMFIEVSEAALESVRRAIEIDETEPSYHQQLANVYSTLSVSGVDGAQENAIASLEEAQTYDPVNPKYHFALAQVALITDDRETALAELQKALELKSNYLPAIQLQSDIAIVDETVEALIEEVSAIISLEPGNAARAFQLGFLHAANDNPTEAVDAFIRAIILDPQYADARYSLAVQYLELDRVDDALVELRNVQATNPNNAELNELIEYVSSDAYTNEEPLPPVNIDRETVGEVPSGGGSDAIVPVNTVPESNL